MLTPDSASATPDLNVLAGVARGERVEVEAQCDRTLDLFQRTLQIIDTHSEAGASPLVADQPPPREYLPEHADLRQRFLFAETIGSYGAVHDLLNGYSPAYQIFSTARDCASLARLNAREVDVLEAYRDQIHEALEHASRYLLENLTHGFTDDELRALNDILREARQRFDEVNTVLGINLIRAVEQAVVSLHQLSNTIETVESRVDGSFWVDSEVMFIPTNHLIQIVNTIFAAVGNPYVAKHIDGILLLAGRNLLIRVVSFYAYYGRQQIYSTVKRNSASVNRAAIAHYIRTEIRGLFKACKTGNQLVLKRVMATAEQQFEISMEALRLEAEASALEAVESWLPQEPPPPIPTRPSWYQRVAHWLFR
ncbi:MAG: hypothetical protein EXR86_09845 [Gammaproteobacteria bacterium]|nr:hypothetical protein [Gammaproteobacteria bacterium]